MRKMLAAGILLVLGALLSMQAHAQTAVSAPILEALQIKGAAAQEIVAAEQKLRDLKMLQTEIEQLKVVLNNAKRASPKLWDGSLNVFENLANATNPLDTLAMAGRDFGDALNRAGCTNGLLQGATGRTTDNVLVDPAATPKPDEIIAARRRNELEGRCMRLLAGLRTKKEIAEAAEVAKKETVAQLDPNKGQQESLDYTLAAMNRMMAQEMQRRRDEAELRAADQARELDEVRQQRTMHESLMKAPPSNRQIRAHDPGLTVDPRNY